jgi:hypothetical protein
MSESSPDAMPDAMEQAIHAHVAQFGWHVQFVSPTSDENRPAWAYTIGLYRSYRHPELAIAGVDMNEVHKTLSVLVRQIQAGTPIRPAQVYTELFADGIFVRFFDIDPRWYAACFGRAIDFYGGTDFPMLQGVWSDTAGRFPWDAGHDSRLANRQFYLFGPEAYQRGMADVNP